MADKLHDRNGIELATGRPLFPIAALRSMGWIAGENTSWAIPDEDDLENEPMLVMLWEGATRDTPVDGTTDKNNRDLYLDDTVSVAQAAAMLAEAVFDFLQTGPIAHWWEACGEDDDAKATITPELAYGVRQANQAAEIGRLAAGAVVHLLSGYVDETYNRHRRGWRSSVSDREARRAPRAANAAHHAGSALRAGASDVPGLPAATRR